MSVQFGKVRFDDAPINPEGLERLNALTVPYGADSSRVYKDHASYISFGAFHSTRESRLEIQPRIIASGIVVSWDGRLDNRSELVHLLSPSVDSNSTDVEIVASAYESWGEKCFSKLIGDWAVSIWNPHDRSLILAKDPIGVRHLYYTVGEDEVIWSTILEPLILFSTRSLRVNEEYIAGWLVSSPAPHLTPYVGVHSVPPSACVVVRREKSIVRKYWDFDPAKRIRYGRDEEYEEHFRNVFSESVRRRLRSDSPILAELSGGMDSSSIVCVADSLMSKGLVHAPRLDTVSYFDDTEPNWNERPYFGEVEQRRGRTGCHISTKSVAPFLGPESARFSVAPGSDTPPSEFAEQFAKCVISQGNRVLLSGIGGDEVTGGVPTPTPEFADMIVRGQLRPLAHQLFVWAVYKRKPWFHLLLESLRAFFPRVFVGVPRHRRPASWFTRRFARNYGSALSAYEPRIEVFGPLPSFQMNMDALNGLRGLIGSSYAKAPHYERRYPYLDRDMLEFLFAVPRDQMVRVGQRRSLMRRALVGIVPDAILQRKRKAFVARAPLAAAKANWNSIERLKHDMESERLGIVDSTRFLEAAAAALTGQEISLCQLVRTLVLESWLRGLNELQVSPVTLCHRSAAAPTVAVALESCKLSN